MEVVAQKKLRVAINGFGRIGRNFLRCWEGRKDSLLEVVCVNDSGGVKQAAHLLKYDTTLGKFAADVKAVDDKTISVNGKNITVVSSRDPTQLPWKAMDIDLVIEGTGVFIDTPGAGKHIQVSGTHIWLASIKSAHLHSHQHQVHTQHASISTVPLRTTESSTCLCWV
jgi:glyceraldehyde-3-phosphate dehydrogenase (NADP+) (phosphorylating)